MNANETDLRHYLRESHFTVRPAPGGVFVTNPPALPRDAVFVREALAGMGWAVDTWGGSAGGDVWLVRPAVEVAS